MGSLLIAVISFIGYIIMYNLYGKFIGKKIFNLNPDFKVPSQTQNDGIDFVPTKKEIIFGHHYTSIAGTGPIVGPAIAVIWGWLPALLWIFFGSIFMGAVHDFGSLVISLRNQGKSISDYTGQYISKRARFLFFAIVFLELLIVIAIFGLVIALIFKMFPSSVFPVWMQIPIAIALGFFVYKKNTNPTISSIIAVILMYITIGIGTTLPINIPDSSLPATGIWTIILLVYAFIASTLPVTTLLQPRDYINSHQLIIALVLICLGILTASFTGVLEISAPVINSTPKEAPSMWPFLFITIACGAISGFHCLVSSGTSSKQIKNENDSLFVGYGSMLMEGMLAILVLIAVAAGIGIEYDFKGTILKGHEAWAAHYSTWTAAKGLGSKVGAFVTGAANMIATANIPKSFALAIMGVFVASFAGTTLDSATRIQRYVISELFSYLNIKIFQNRYIAAFFAVLTAAFLAFATGANGSGALKLWPLFGAVNQTLAALALIIITIYLKKRGKFKWLVSGIPAVFMIIMTIWAIIENQISFVKTGNYLLTIVNGIIIIITLSVTVEGLISFLKKN